MLQYYDLKSIEYQFFRRRITFGTLYLRNMLLLEEIANIWSLRLYSLLHLTNFTFFLPNKLRYEETNNDNHVSEGFSSLVVFAIWSILYYVYKKFLNLMLRRMRFTMIRRIRLIDGLWCCGFSVCSMIFFVYSAKESQDCPWRRAGGVYHPSFLIQKTFYLHQAAIEVFSHNRWLKGWTSQLFASSIPVSSSQKWPEALVVLLFYKASDTALLNICRLLMTLSRRKIVKRLAKFIFILHFFNWIYVHILLVPGSLIFYTDTNRNLKMQASMWTWLICELLNSIRYKEFCCLYSKQTLEISLFPRPCQETVEFVNILKKHRSCVNNDKSVGEASAQKQKNELWQTIVCAMTMKKKLKKIREVKRKAEDSRDSNKAVNKIYKHP